jgi:dolichol kinase
MLKLVILYTVQFCTGLLVKHKGMKVNYTRKINHFVLFFVPLFLDRALAYDKSFGYFTLGAVAAVLSLVIYIEPIRKKVPPIATMFISFDRPEDRPHTLFWLTTQLAAGYMVLLPMIVLFYYYDLMAWIFIPVLINGIGDGLAEPVGVRFGRHSYTVRALFSSKKYVRTLEGSACVFLTTIIIVAFFHATFTPGQLVSALIVLPLLMTLAEAISPHTWDTPFLFLVGYLTLFGISFI